MTERRKAPAPRAQAKIKQLETRLARVEADLERVRAKAARGGGAHALQVRLDPGQPGLELLDLRLRSRRGRLPALGHRVPSVCSIR